jgi:hypothetical protein
MHEVMNTFSATTNTPIEKKTVLQVHGKPGADIAVIMAGYEPQILKMIRDQNPGLARRFNATQPFKFVDFDNDELLEIMSQTCKAWKLHVPFNVKMYAVEELAKLRALPNFGNAGALETMLTNAKSRMTERLRQEREKKVSGQDIKEYSSCYIVSFCVAPEHSSHS